MNYWPPFFHLSFIRLAQKGTKMTTLQLVVVTSVTLLFWARLLVLSNSQLTRVLARVTFPSLVLLALALRYL